MTEASISKTCGVYTQTQSVYLKIHFICCFFFQVSYQYNWSSGCVLISIMSYKWECLKGMPTKRVFSTPVECDGKLYVVGGCDEKGIPLASMEVYDPQRRQWTELPDMPTKRAGPAVGVVGKKIVAFGGVSTSQEPLDSVEMYDVDKKVWTVMESMKERLLGISCVVRGG